MYRYTATYSFPEMLPPEGVDEDEWVVPSVEKSITINYWKSDANISVAIEGGNYATLEQMTYDKTSGTIVFTGLGDSAVLVIRVTDKETLRTNDYRIRLVVTG